jgi:hypothetical protein
MPQLDLLKPAALLTTALDATVWAGVLSVHSNRRKTTMAIIRKPQAKQNVARSRISRSMTAHLAKGKAEGDIPPARPVRRIV